MYMFFSHLSKKYKNLNWHFISNELWTVYFVPKGTTTKLDLLKRKREEKNRLLIKYTVIFGILSEPDICCALQKETRVGYFKGHMLWMP